MPEGDDEAGEMEKGFIHLEMLVVAHQQASEVAQPGESPLDLPAFAIAAQPAAVVEGRLFSVPAMKD